MVLTGASEKFQVKKTSSYLIDIGKRGKAFH